jgi:hypothetical protein
LNSVEQGLRRTIWKKGKWYFTQERKPGF